MKNCIKCGAQLEDDAVFCTNCGSNQNAQPAPVNQQLSYEQPAFGGQPAFNGQPAFGGQPMYNGYQQPPKKSKKGLIIGLCAGGVALVAIILVLVFFVFGGSEGGSSPEDFAKKFVEAMNDLDVDAMCELRYPGTVSDDDIEELEDQFKQMKQLKNMGYKFSYKFEKLEDVEYINDKDAIKELEEEFYDAFDKKIKIQQICEGKMKLSYTVEYNGEKQSDSQRQSMRLMKVDGKWYAAKEMN